MLLDSKGEDGTDKCILYRICSQNCWSLAKDVPLNAQFGMRKYIISTKPTHTRKKWNKQYSHSKETEEPIFAFRCSDFETYIQYPQLNLVAVAMTAIIFEELHLKSFLTSSGTEAESLTEVNYSRRQLDYAANGETAHV